MAHTLLDKLWTRHVVARLDDGRDLLHVDRHMIYEVTSLRAFERLRDAGRRVRNPELTFATIDHIVATCPGRRDDTFAPAGPYVRRLRGNARAAGIRLFDLDDPRQGIVHVVAPELGIALPGATLVCGDSHTCTVGALGALAFGIGTSQVEHVLATQTIAMSKPRQMRITMDGRLGDGVSAKDLIVHLIAHLGASAGAGHALELAGSTVRSLPVESRLTLCNMAVELGSAIGLIAPDDITYEYLHGRPFAPADRDWDAALMDWRELRTDPDATFDREVRMNAGGVSPQITWGTSPEHAVPVTGRVPDPADAPAERRDRMRRALEYMALEPGDALEGLPVDRVFIGSCTNSRLEDLRAAAAIARGRRVARGVRALVVPGSGLVRASAEAEGLHRIFTAAGFQWREPGCSMCVGLNDDALAPGERCVSTSNRNFEGRQGPGGRTHLASPATAAAAAVTGAIADPRRLAAGA